MSPDKDVLSNMFSSFVSRKTRACSPAPSPPMSLHQQPPATSPPPLVLPHLTPHSNPHHPFDTHHSTAAVSNLNPFATSPSTHSLRNHMHPSQPPVNPHSIHQHHPHHPQYHHHSQHQEHAHAYHHSAEFSVGNEAPPAKTPRHSRSRSSRVSSSRNSSHPHSQSHSQHHPMTSTVAGAAPALASGSVSVLPSAPAPVPPPSPVPVALPNHTSPPTSSNHPQDTGPSSSRVQKRPSHLLTQNHSRNKSGSKSSSSDRQHEHQHAQKQCLQVTVRDENDARGDRKHSNTGGASSSVHGGRGSAGSVEAIATDSTAAATPFHCDRCSKAFRQRSQLSRHFLRVHERKKPFGCAHCDKCFASAFDRKRHVEAVHGRRCIEFFCDRCSFRSKQEHELEQHIRTVHERDQCRLCGKMFKRAANLVAHERHYHSKASTS